MFQNDRIWVGLGEDHCDLLLKQANRHGIIAGASGTGKTVTVKVLAEGFSQAGVPVFMADVKGDVTGLAQAGDDSESMQERIKSFGIEDWSYKGCPVRFWDMLGGEGAPVRITVSDMGPIMLSRMLGLTDVQEGVLNIVFRVADDQGLLIIDMKDLRAMLNYVSEHSKEYETVYGKVSSQSVGAILRALIAIEDQGANDFFGEPALDLSDFIACNSSGQGYVNVLNAASLIQSPQVYAMFLLWMLTELFQTLPEVGDPEKPKLVFFFDEAHLLFNNMPKVLVDKVVQVVKLIRSKGVGVYFISQSPSDIPDEVLSQLSNRIQHGLRAYTPAEQKNIRAAAQAFRENPAFDAEEALQELGTGQALVSLLDADGRPSIVERARILPPQCRMAAADPQVIMQAISDESQLMSKYGDSIDRESAFEILDAQRKEAEEADALAAERAALQKEREEFEKMKAAEAEKQQKEAEKAAEKAEKEAAKAAEKAEKEAAKAAEKAEREAEKAAEKAERALEKQRERQAKTVNSIIGQVGREAGRQLIRGLFGSLKK